MTAPSVDYYAALVHGLRVQPDRKGEVWLPCPECGKDKRHFSFSTRGAKCFVCGYRPSLRKLTEQLLGDRAAAPVSRPEPAPLKPRPWQGQADVLARSFAQSPGTVEAWQAYKPLPVQVIRGYQLGLGIWPGGLFWPGKEANRAEWGNPAFYDKDQGPWWKCLHRRLIVPLFSAGEQIGGFRCRAIECPCKKWLSPGGSELVLYNAGAIRHGQELAIVENPADALLVASHWLPAVATLGVTIWKDEYTEILRSTQPSKLMVCFDNDGPGQQGGVKLVGKLRASGFEAHTFDWAGYAAGADIGDLFHAAHH